MATNRHKMAFLTWLVIYPMITVLLAFLEPVLADLGLALRTLVLTVLVVPAMVYVVMPFATTRLRGWLTVEPRTHRPSAQRKRPS